MQLIIEIAIVSILFVIVGLLIDAWLVKAGVARDTNRLGVVLVVVIGVVSRQFLGSDISWWLWGVFMLFLLVFSLHRTDFEGTWKMGPWWWKSKRKKRK